MDAEDELFNLLESYDSENDNPFLSFPESKIIYDFLDFTLEEIKWFSEKSYKIEYEFDRSHNVIIKEGEFTVYRKYYHLLIES